MQGSFRAQDTGTRSVHVFRSTRQRGDRASRSPGPRTDEQAQRSRLGRLWLPVPKPQGPGLRGGGPRPTRRPTCAAPGGTRDPGALGAGSRAPARGAGGASGREGRGPPGVRTGSRCGLPAAACALRPSAVSADPPARRGGRPPAGDAEASVLGAAPCVPLPAREQARAAGTRSGTRATLPRPGIPAARPRGAPRE